PCLADPRTLVSTRRADVVAALERARRSIGARLDSEEQNLTHTRARVVMLSPQATLDRGYAVLRIPDGTVVRDAAEVLAGQHLTARLARGELPVIAE
ncbi:MAG: exodeoxyribonuclease VII large subunit, partial [Actinomycetota bacterium]|nr:exodeoxyribonuclease VII large subunit [Actinomycetota bacterium]